MNRAIPWGQVPDQVRLEIRAKTLRDSLNLLQALPAGTLCGEFEQGVQWSAKVITAEAQRLENKARYGEV